MVGRLSRISPAARSRLYLAAARTQNTSYYHYYNGYCFAFKSPSTFHYLYFSLRVCHHRTQQYPIYIENELINLIIYRGNYEHEINGMRGQY